MMRLMRQMVTLAALTLMMAVASGCATNAELAPTQLNPAAVGQVWLEEGREGENHEVKIKVEHMAPPQRIDDDLSTYVVWLRSRGQKEWSNVGQLSVGADRDARLSVPTVFRELDVLITAEPQADVQTPGQSVVLQGAVEAGS